MHQILRGNLAKMGTCQEVWKRRGSSQGITGSFECSQLSLSGPRSRRQRKGSVGQSRRRRRALGCGVCGSCRGKRIRRAGGRRGIGCWKWVRIKRIHYLSRRLTGSNLEDAGMCIELSCSSCQNCMVYHHLLQETKT